MNQNSYYFLFSLLAAVFILSPTLTDAKCNSCGVNNGIACVNETSFNMCFDNNPDTSKLFHCPEGEICTRSAMKCVQPNMGMEADCSPSKGCGICDGSKMFACTSRTTFVQCNRLEVTSNTGKCPPGLTCDSSNVEVCVNDCNLPTTLECELDSP